MVSRAFPLALLVAFGLMLVVAVTTARGAARPASTVSGRCDRAACRVMGPSRQTWICPELPGGAVVVRRDTCFVLAWPEPTL